MVRVECNELGKIIAASGRGYFFMAVFTQNLYAKVSERYSFIHFIRSDSGTIPESLYYNYQALILPILMYFGKKNISTDTMLTRVFIFSILSVLYTSVRAQANTDIHSSDSAFFKALIKGNIKQFRRWTDRLGDNYLLLTETDEAKSTARISKYGVPCNGGCSDKELYAYHFIGKDSLLWKLNDFMKACNVDNIAEFRKGATKITDLDKNGIAEIWIMYSMTCTSDVSPRTLKLIMYEGNKKYAIRGTSQPAKNMTDEKFGAKYIPGNEFESLSQAFKDFAKKLWVENLYDIR